MHVQAHDLVESTEVNPGADALGVYHLHDLIQLQCVAARLFASARPGRTD